MRIEAVEKALLELARRLDESCTSKGEPDDVAKALGDRAKALYQGYLGVRRCACSCCSPALLRPMVEADILLRFIRDEPDWRARLWQAESRRIWLGVAEQIHHRPLPHEQQLVDLPTLETIGQQRAEIERLRQEALDAGVRGVPPRRRLTPTVQEQVELLNTTEAWQAFVVAYMPLTLDQHVSDGSFRDAVQHVLDDGRVIHQTSTA